MADDYEEFLRWRDRRHRDALQLTASSTGTFPPQAPPVRTGPAETAIEMEPVPVRPPFLENVNSMLGQSYKALDEEASKDAKYLKLSEGREAQPVTFAWRDVTLKVPIKEGGFMGLFQRKTGREKYILDQVSGFIEPGQVLFIMGPSGAGKSSMLDALADRVKAPVTGVQFLNGKIKTPMDLKRVSKYVQQEDTLLGALTVRETFAAATAFYVADSSKRTPLVHAVASMLGLTEQLNTKVGDMFFRGLSGGQKRRVSIGIELIAQPAMLFLDEPTSGLDSASAFSIMTSIRKYARATNTPVLCTIHQPSELLFELGDALLLLSGGEQVYFGPLSGLEPHFNALGFECPERTSISEWLLDLVNRDFGEHAVVDKCVNSWVTSPAKAALDANLQRLNVPAAAPPQKETFLNPLPYRTNQMSAMWALFKRGFLNAMRAPAVIWFRFAMYFMLSILIGTIWLLLGDSAKVISDVNGALFFTTAFMIFMSISVLPMYLEERHVFIRERANASYSVTAYLIAHLGFELPFVFLLALVCSSTVYWLVGFWPDPNKFFIFVANLFMGLMVAESIMVLIAATIPYFVVGIAVGAFTFGAFMCVMGYFIAFSQIGWWWRWLRYVAVHYYNFSTFMTNQYVGNVYKAIPNTTNTSFPYYPNDVKGDTIVAYYDLETRIWLNFVVQIIMIFGYRFLAWIYMSMFIRGKK